MSTGISPALEEAAMDKGEKQINATTSAANPLSEGNKGDGGPRRLVLERAGQTLGEAIKTQRELTQQTVLRAYGIGTKFGVSLPYSRKQELEADRLGLLYMARVAYDPRESIAFWQRFSAHSQKAAGRQIELLSTHPLDETRIRQLESHVPQALADYEITNKGR